MAVELTRGQSQILDDLVDMLSGIDGIEAIALGGSYARGRARPDSDLDVGLFYDEDKPFAISEICAVAEKLNDRPNPVVTDFGEWGPWVNGGAWLTIREQRVDLLYRSLDQIERVIDEAQLGRHELHFGQQPPFGFFGPTYLGEILVAVPYSDPSRKLECLKTRVSEYPERLRVSVVQDYLWPVDFGLAAFAPKFAQLRDAYGTVGCLARFVHHLTLVLFALNRVYFVNDKTALSEIDEFDVAPLGFSRRAQSALANPGESIESLQSAVGATRDLFIETAALAGDLYQPKFSS